MSDAPSTPMHQNDTNVENDARGKEINGVLDIMAAALNEIEMHVAVADTSPEGSAGDAMAPPPRKEKQSWQADLCAALLYIRVAEASTEEEDEEGEELPPIIQLPLNKTDDMNEELFAAIMDTLLNTKGQQQPAAEDSTEGVAGWIPRLLTPLFEKWTRQKIACMMQAQQTVNPEEPSSSSPPPPPPIDSSAYDFMDRLATIVNTKLSHAYSQRDREMAQRNMDQLFSANGAETSSPATAAVRRDAAPLQSLKERLGRLVDETAPRQQLRMAADVMGTFGSLAAACASYRTLCTAAFTLLRLSLSWHLQDVRLATLEEMVLQQEKRAKGRTARGDPETLKREQKEEGYEIHADMQAKVRRCAQVRMAHYVHQLMSFWMYLFGRFGGETLYVKEMQHHAQEKDDNGLRLTRQFMLSETDWIFLVLITLYAENNTSLFAQPPGGGGLSDEESPHVPAMDALSVDALSSFFSSLLQSLLAYATAQLQCAPLATKPLSFASAVLCRRPFVWDLLRHVDVLARDLLRATMPASSATVEEEEEEVFRARLLRPLQERWGSLVGLYTSLTDVRPPAGMQDSRSGANDTNALLTYKAYKEKMTALFKIEKERWEDPLTLDSGGDATVSTTLSKRQEHLRLLEQLVRCHATATPSWGSPAPSSSKRSREARQEEEERANVINRILTADTCLEQVCYMTPFEKYTRYMGEVFLPVHDEKCFTLLLMDRQRRLTRVLQSLQRRIERGKGGGKEGEEEERSCEEKIATAMQESHRMWKPDDAHFKNPFRLPAAPTTTTTTAAAAAAAAAATVASTPKGDDDDVEEEEVLWSSDDENENVKSPPPLSAPPSDTTSTAIASSFSVTRSAGWMHEHALLRQESKLVMLVAHSTFVLLQRFGAISAEDQDALVEHVIPLLLHLSETSKDKWQELLSSSSSTALSDSSGQRLQWRCARFCLYAFIVAEVVSIKWDLNEVGLMWLRYQMVVTHMLDRCEADRSSSSSDGATVIDRALPELESWVREGGGSPKSRVYGTHVATFLQEVDTLLREQNPIYATMNTNDAVTKSAVLDQCLRCVTPLRPPPACALLLVLSAYRTMSQRLMQFRADLEEQRCLAKEEGNMDYLHRTETYCTAQDVSVLRTIVFSVHRCVFGYTLQSLGLLRLWLGYLAHIFTEVVPPPQSTEAMQLMPRSWQLDGEVVNSLGERVHRVGWRALRPSSEQSAQTALRVAVGELLADLALLPLADPTAAQNCPYVFPADRAYAEPELASFAAAERAAAAQDSAVLQRLLPVAVLEELCLFLKIDTGRKTTTAVADQRGAGTRLEESFLGLAGVCAFCKRWESCVLPGSVTDPRVGYLLRRVWAAVDTVVMGS